MEKLRIITRSSMSSDDDINVYQCALPPPWNGESSRKCATLHPDGIIGVNANYSPQREVLPGLESFC